MNMDNWFTTIEAAWSADSDSYDSLIKKQLSDKGAVRHWQRELSGLLGPGPLRILDVGCGPGFFSIMLLMLGHQVTSIDGAEGMVLHAEENIRRLGLTPDVRRADAVLLEGFQPDSLDAIVSRDVVWTLYDPPKAFLRWKELIRPGGQVIIFDGDYRREHSSLRYHALKFISDIIKKCTEPKNVKPSHHAQGNGFDELPMIRHERPAYDGVLLKEAGYGKVETRPDYYRNSPLRPEFWKYGYQGKKFRVVAEK